MFEQFTGKLPTEPSRMEHLCTFLINEISQKTDTVGEGNDISNPESPLRNPLEGSTELCNCATQPNRNNPNTGNSNLDNNGQNDVVALY